MKKYSSIVLLGLLMVGCSSQDISQRAEIMYSNPNTISTDTYYTQDMAKDFKFKALKEEVEHYNQGEHNVWVDYEEKDYWDDYASVDFNYSYVDLDQEGLLLLDNKMVNYLEGDLTPGIKAFIEKVCEEKEDISPQSVVINNQPIIMYPVQLYTENQQPLGNNLMISLNDLEIKSKYLKQLIAAVDKSKFVVQEPAVIGKGLILQLSTPFYIQESGVRYENATDKMPQNVIYPKSNVSFKLYIKDDQIEEIQVVVKQDDIEGIDDILLSPIIIWLKNEWQVDEVTLNGVQEILEAMDKGTCTKSKGIVGNCQYYYDIQKGTPIGRRIMELTLKPNN